MNRDEMILRRAEDLLAQCNLGDRDKAVQDNHLAWVLSHLRRHRNPQATRQMVEALTTSSLARRSKSSPAQFDSLRNATKSVLTSTKDWHQAAQIIGWARRLMHAPQVPRHGRR